MLEVVNRWLGDAYFYADYGSNDDRFRHPLVVNRETYFFFYSGLININN